MNSLYYQYGTGGPAMQTPDYQTFLKLLEQMRKMNGGDASSSGSQSSGGGQQKQQGGLANLLKMFSTGGGAPSMASMNGAAAPGSFDTPTGGLGGMAGLFA